MRGVFQLILALVFLMLPRVGTPQKNLSPQTIPHFELEPARGRSPNRAADSTGAPRHAIDFQRADSLQQAGLAAFRSGHPQRAATLFQQAVFYTVSEKKTDRTARLYLDLANAYNTLGKTEAREKALRDALAFAESPVLRAKVRSRLTNLVYNKRRHEALYHRGLAGVVPPHQTPLQKQPAPRVLPELVLPNAKTPPPARETSETALSVSEASPASEEAVTIEYEPLDSEEATADTFLFDPATGAETGPATTELAAPAPEAEVATFEPQTPVIKLKTPARRLKHGAGLSFILLIAIFGAIFMSPSARARTYYLMGRYNATTRVCEKVLMRNPRKLSLYPLLARAYYSSDRHCTRAIRAYEKVLTLNMDFQYRSEIRQIVAQRYLKEGRSDQTAIEILEQALNEEQQTRR